MRTLLSWGLCCALATGLPSRGFAQEHTTVGGYGEVHFTNATGPNTPGVVNPARFVGYLAQPFADRLTFPSEVEIEHAKVEGGQPGGEVSVEQAFLDY